MYLCIFLLIYSTLCKIKFISFLYFIHCVQITPNHFHLWNLDRNHIILTKIPNFNKYSFVNNKIHFNKSKSLNNYDKSSTHNTAVLQLEELEEVQTSDINKLNENIINKINLLSKDLYNQNLNRIDFIKQLTTIGREVYLDSPNSYLFQKLPNSTNLLKEFDTNDLLKYNKESRDYFIIKSPGCVKYKLLQDCSFFTYFSVFVDKNKHLYIDGTSESLIYRGIISILVSIINNSILHKINDNDLITNININDIVTNNDIINNLIDHNIINENTIKSIIKHIQNEYNDQIHLIDSINSNTNNKIDVHNIVNKDHINDSIFDGLLKKTSQKKVAVLLSGGVDSSLSLWILKNRGYYVEAFYLLVNDINDDTGTCKSDDLKYAKEVCKKIGVKLNVLPFSKLYYDDILRDFIENYKRGEVPNPDVLCNNKIKFGQFLNRAVNWGFDYVSSGHYASIMTDKSLDVGRRIRRLKVCKDQIKDQTYFLSKLNQFQLSKLIFPLEGLTKQQVREYARIIGLSSFNKDDSVGLCFLEDLNISEYLLNKLGEDRGPIVDFKTNQIIGEHLGLFNYSIGQRKNLNNYIFKKCSPNILRYVIKKDLYNNVLYVTENYDSTEYTQPGGIRTSFRIEDIFFNGEDYAKMLKRCKIEDRNLTHGDSYSLRVKLRHSPKFYDSITCLYNTDNNKSSNISEDGAHDFSNIATDVAGINSRNRSTKYNAGTVYLNEPDSGISTGQYCVFYLDDFCLGSAKMVTNY